jgi:peptidylamidoglycolate lyase
MFVSPHKLAVDRDGFLWLADNGGHQVFKVSQDGKVLLTLGKKGVAGAGLDASNNHTSAMANVRSR